MTFDQAIQLIQLTVTIVALFLMYRSVPGHLIDRLIADARPHVEKSPTKLDDILLGIGEMLRGQQHETDTTPSMDGETRQDLENGVQSE